MDPVVIVGGGIVGTSLAYHLRTADRPVRLLERDALGSGTTAASVAQFMWYQGHPHPLAHRLRELSWAIYRPLVDAGTIGFDPIGTYHAAATAAGHRDLERLADELDEVGAAAHLVPPGDLERFGFDPTALSGALCVPRDGVLDPGEIVAHYAAEARAAGVEIRTSVEVIDVLTERGAVAGVETSSGVVEAGDVVNAAGPWAPRVAGMAGIDLPLRHTYGPIVVLETGRETDLPLTLLPDDYYVREEGPTGVLVGNFATEYDEAPVLDPDAAHAIDHEFYLAAADSLATYLPALADADVVAEWVGLRTVTPDGWPYVGETGLPGYHVACGMSGYGITLSPAVGRLLAGWLTDDQEETLSGAWASVPRSDVAALRAFLSPARAD